MDCIKIEQYIVKNISHKQYYSYFFLIRKIKSAKEYAFFEKEFVKTII